MVPIVFSTFFFLLSVSIPCFSFFTALEPQVPPFYFFKNQKGKPF
jgi:hypothetical protein